MRSPDKRDSLRRWYKAVGPVRVLVTDASHPVTEEGLRLIADRYPGCFTFVGFAAHEPRIPGTAFDSWHMSAAPDGDDFDDSLVAAVRHSRARLVLPWSDVDALAAVRRRSQLTRFGATVVAPSRRIVELCVDKLNTESSLAGVVPFVRSLGVSSARELRRAARDLGYPRTTLLMKPRTGSGGRGHWLVSARPRVHGTPPEVPLDAACSTLDALRKQDFLVQRQLSGNDYSIDFMAQAGRVRQLVVRQRLSALGGVSLEGIIQPSRPELEVVVSRVCKQLRWSGIGNLQLFVTPSCEVAVYEINPRPSGSVAVAPEGVDLVVSAMTHALKGPAVHSTVERETAFRRYLATIWATSGA